MEFPCAVEAVTQNDFGQKLFLHRSFEGCSSKIFNYALQVLVNRHDRALPFINCELTIKTPIKDYKVILKDNFGCRELVSIDGKVLAMESN